MLLFADLKDERSELLLEVCREGIFLTVFHPSLTFFTFSLRLVKESRNDPRVNLPLCQNFDRNPNSSSLDTLLLIFLQYIIMISTEFIITIINKIVMDIDE